VIARGMTKPELAKLGARPFDLSRPVIRMATLD